MAFSSMLTQYWPPPPTFSEKDLSPKGGYNLEETEKCGTNNAHINYATSKAANWMVADEAARRCGKDDIISVVQNPGNLKTQIYNTQTKLMMFVVNRLLYPPKLGSYTELYAGLSPEITEKHQGGLIMSWGRVQARNPRKDIHEALEEGRGGVVGLDPSPDQGIYLSNTLLDSYSQGTNEI